MKLKNWWALLPAAALAFSAPAFAKTDADKEKEMEQARRELRAARDELQRAARELARISREANKDSPRALAYEYFANPRRAVLGITIAPGPEKDGEVRGVLVTGVTPGGGADKAGLKSGDLLLIANGQSLAARPGDKTGVEHKLVAIMSKLEPGNEVKLDYEREGKRNAVTAVAQRFDPGAMLSFHDDDDGDVLLPMPPMPPMPPSMHWMGGGSGLQLARLDDDLAAYFKTQSGVLVVKAPKDGKLGLKSGDVIQKVGNQAVNDPRAVMDALGEHEAGDKLQLEVVRQGKLTRLEGTLPERSRKRIEIETDEP